MESALSNQTKTAPQIATSKNTARVRWIDTARGAAMIAIVLGHTLLEGDIHTYLFSFHVPLFFVLAGLVFSVHANETFLGFFARKAKALLIPYLFFGLLTWLIFTVLGGMVASTMGYVLASDSPLDYILRGLLYANGRDGFLKFNEPLWFLPALLMAECFLYGIHYAATHVPQKAALLVEIAGLILFVVLFWLFNGIETQAVPPLPFSLECSVSLAPFMIAGWMIKRHVPLTKIPPLTSLGHADQETLLQEELDRSRTPSILILALVAVFLIVLGWNVSLTNITVDYKASLYGDILTYAIASVSGCCGWLMICYLISQNKPLEYLGQNTMSVLCIHKLPVLACQIAPTPLKGLLANQNLIAALAVTAFAIFVSLLAGYVLQKIWPPLVGKRSKPKNSGNPQH